MKKMSSSRLPTLASEGSAIKIVLMMVRRPENVRKSRTPRRTRMMLKVRWAHAAASPCPGTTSESSTPTKDTAASNRFQEFAQYFLKPNPSTLTITSSAKMPEKTMLATSSTWLHSSPWRQYLDASTTMFSMMAKFTKYANVTELAKENNIAPHRLLAGFSLLRGVARCRRRCVSTHSRWRSVKNPKPAMLFLVARKFSKITPTKRFSRKNEPMKMNMTK